MKMRLGVLFLSSLVSATLAVAAGSGSAPAVKACAIGKPTPASYKWDFKGEANAIFKHVQADAVQAKYHADRLQSFKMDPNLTRTPYASQLRQLKSEVNDMGSRLCRLETIRRVVAPWQQRMIDQIATSTRLMADNVQDAITLCNEGPGGYKFPTYSHYTHNVYDESTALMRALDSARKTAGVS